ncbi:MAG: DNA-binding response regulator [Acidimicrobiales bacterium]
MKIPVFVHADDPVLQAGVTALLRGRPEATVVEATDLDTARVVIVAADDVDEPTVRTARALQRNGSMRLVLVITNLGDAALLAGIGAGACGFVRRSEATPERLGAVVRSAASGDGAVPPDLLGRLLEHMSSVQSSILEPRGLSLSGLSERETTVLRLVAEGLETSEIAERLCFSERTVKGVIHEVTTRLRLRNRAQAVAYAVRQGLI